LLLLFTLTIVGILWFSAANSQPRKTTSSSQWQQVAIGGGGYVTGIYLHPGEANLVYMQTDNGGFYKWQSDTNRWQPLIDRLPAHPWNHYGGEALALDPNNPDLIYLALGKYRSSNGKLWKSSDRGMTWKESDLRVPMGGDEEKRWAGNRLAVSPFDSNLLLFGSRSSGLWRSLDGGMHWSQVKFGLI
jgi:xyloglucan-specific exo-beta-1,4-glucanase